MNLGTFGLRDSQASPNKDIIVFLTNCGQSFLLLWFRWLQTHNFKDNREIPKWWISYFQFLLINRVVINTNRHANTQLI